MSERNFSPVRVALLGLALVGLGTVGFHEIPGMMAEDAAGNKLVNSIYCSVMTLTTVGFGDICPGESLDGLGRAYIVFLSFAGLGMFCGPIMDLAASWKEKFPLSDKVALLSMTVATSVFLFSYLLEEMSESEAAYFSIITGTTIGYGDISPKTDAGKLAAALYAVLAVNVMASFLEPAKQYLLGFCQVPPPAEKTETQSTTEKEKEDDVSEDTKNDDVDDETEEKDQKSENEKSETKKDK